MSSERTQFRNEYFDRLNMRAGARSALFSAIVALFLLFGNFSMGFLPLRIMDIALLVVSVFVASHGFLAQSRQEQEKGEQNNRLMAIEVYIYCTIAICCGIIHATFNMHMGTTLAWFFLFGFLTVGIVYLSPIFSTIIVMVSAFCVVYPAILNRNMYMERLIAIVLFCCMILLVALYRYFNTVAEADEAFERERQQAVLRTLNVRDKLTGLYNRVELRMCYDEYTDNDIIVMMIGLDKFKAVNRDYGKDVGDQVLKNVTKLLLDVYGDLCSYRYEGDKFLVIVPDSDLEDFEQKRAALGERIHEASDELLDKPISFSAGYVYGYCDYEASLRNMMNYADELLHLAKKQGSSGCESATVEEMLEVLASREESEES